MNIMAEIRAILPEATDITIRPANALDHYDAYTMVTNSLESLLAVASNVYMTTYTFVELPVILEGELVHYESEEEIMALLGEISQDALKRVKNNADANGRSPLQDPIQYAYDVKMKGKELICDRIRQKQMKP